MYNKSSQSQPHKSKNMILSDVIAKPAPYLVLMFELDAGDPVSPRMRTIDAAGKMVDEVELSVDNLDFSEGVLKMTLSDYRAVHYAIAVPSIKKYGLGFGATMDDATGLCEQIGIKEALITDTHLVMDSHDDSGEVVTLLLAHFDTAINDVANLINRLYPRQQAAA
jgi:hypothetical protein